jgi:hypothetical protein
MRHQPSPGLSRLAEANPFPVDLGKGRASAAQASLESILSAPRVSGGGARSRRRPMRRGGGKVLVVTIAALALVTGVAVAAATQLFVGPARPAVHRSKTTNLLRQQERAAAASANVRPAGSESDATGRGALNKLRHDFAVFRRHTVARGASAISEPPNPPEDLDQGADPGLGLNAADRQYVAITSSFGVWLTPGTGGACLDWPLASDATPETGGGVCSDDLTRIEEGGLFAMVRSTPGSGGATFVGMVPDGTKSVTVTLTDGEVKNPTPHNNVYSLAEPSASVAPFQTLRIESDSGQVSTWCPTCRS